MIKSNFMKAILIVLLVSFTINVFADCKKDPLKEGRTTITFAYFADPDEATAIAKSIDWYNKNAGAQDKIFIEKQPKPGGTYVDYMEKISSGSKGPDVFLLGDRYIKRWATEDFSLLENLQPYIDSAKIDMSNIWSSAVWRNRYNPQKNTNNLTDDMYAMPRDLSPTVIFYNESMFAKHGIKVISVDEKDLDSFNNGASDLNNKTKAQLGIDENFVVPAKGFIRDNPRKAGQQFSKPAYNEKTEKIAEEIIFNNRIAMSWDEVEDLGMIFTQKYNSQLTSNDTKWGYYTEWWFSYGWGVGGDCALDSTGEGDWTFTLGDKTNKKLLYNADNSYATGDGGKAIFVDESKWNDKLSEGQYLGKVLPTQYEAFERFVNLGKPISAGGLEISMRQKADIGTSTPVAFFNNQSVAMVAQPSTSINTFRKGIGNKFDWNIAPLPVYKEYGNDGETVVNRGIEIGHSNETSLGVWRKSKNKEQAFKVLEYLAMGEAQKISAQAGLYLPNDIDLAKSDYVEYNKKLGLAPKNIEILTEVAKNQRPADWWYMPDNRWIDVWATPLNIEYRENDKSLNEFFDAYTSKTNAILDSYKNK